MEHFRKVKKEGNKVKLLMMQRLHNLQHRNISAHIRPSTDPNVFLVSEI